MLLERALESLSAHGVDLLVDLGDRLTDETPELDMRRLRALGAIFDSNGLRREHLRGNHDRLSRSHHESLLGSSTSNRNVVVAGWNLVFLDTYDGSIEGHLSSSTLDWLSATLGSTPHPSIVFSHQPLDGRPLIGNEVFEVTFAAHAHPKGHREARTIICRSGTVRLVLSGHAHWNNVVYVDGVPYVTVQSLVALTSSGDPTGAYTVVDLEATAQGIRVFGRQPFQVHL